MKRLAAASLAALVAVTGAHYEGGRRVGTFATYGLKGRGLGTKP